MSESVYSARWVSYFFSEAAPPPRPQSVVIHDRSGVPRFGRAADDDSDLFPNLLPYLAAPAPKQDDINYEFLDSRGAESPRWSFTESDTLEVPLGEFPEFGETAFRSGPLPHDLADSNTLSTSQTLCSDAKDFICPIEGCGRAYRYKGDLKAHVVKFHGEKDLAESISPSRSTKDSKPFKCPLARCECGYHNKRDLWRHLRQKHPKLFHDIKEGRGADYSD